MRPHVGDGHGQPVQVLPGGDDGLPSQLRGETLDLAQEHAGVVLGQDGCGQLPLIGRLEAKGDLVEIEPHLLYLGHRLQEPLVLVELELEFLLFPQ